MYHTFVHASSSESVRVMYEIVKGLVKNLVWQIARPQRMVAFGIRLAREAHGIRVFCRRLNLWKQVSSEM
jgi:hypothetical protein